jgi:hypothetical protein
MSIYQAAKDALKIARQLGNVELQQQLLDLQAQALELQEENAGLRREKAELEEQLALQGELLPDEGIYWRVEGQTRDGPFCSRCWDVEGRLVRLHVAGLDGWFRCPGCDQNVQHAAASKR